MSKKLLKALLSEIQSLRQQIEGVQSFQTAQAGFAPVYPQTAKKVLSNTESPTFYRYVRPVDDYTGEVSSQEGVTLKINLDYATRTLNFSYAICNHGKGEPSFSKQEGRQHADNRQTYTIKLWEEAGSLDDCDVTAFVIGAIYNKRVAIPVGDRHRILDQFERSLANFWVFVE
jgi:hypothetical protein